ncbi:vitellogenin-2-like [Astyanax mexicanus]|uniref:vitellogenin-2-like n=1 Tax=Astyanax mexicanus TaxID=7994 RepID=UPI0020CAE9E8|nr:vitellogenin-2-like [Astyanax mexicanus]
MDKLSEVVYRVQNGRKTVVVHRDRLALYQPKKMVLIAPEENVTLSQITRHVESNWQSQSTDDEAKRQTTISSSSSTSTSTSTSSASSSEKKKSKKRRKYNKKDKKRSFTKKKTKRQRTLTSSSSSSSTSTSSSSSSDKKKSKKRRKYNKDKKMSFAKRMTTPDQVIHRYGYVLKTYQNCLSVRHALKKHHVEKTTMALTSIIAEVKIASEGENFPVPLYKEGTTLKEFTVKLKRLVESCPALNSKIAELKRCNKLLPLKWKFR